MIHSARNHWLRIVASLTLTLLIVLGAAHLVTPQVVHSQALQLPASPDEIIVKYKSNAQENDKATIRQKVNAKLQRRIDKLHLEILKVPAPARDAILQALNQTPFVQYAEPDFKATATSVTNDTSLTQQWGLFKIDAANSSTQSAWDVTTGDPGVKIAILDTGIDESHPDLTGKVVQDANFTTDATALDNNGHGSHVAGIAAALTNNGSGVAGTGYNASLISGKVLDSSGSGYYSWIASGITWAADQGAKVISMSLGGSASSQALSDAVDYAWSKGAVVVVAAGNSGSSSPSYPAYYTNAIAVAATDSNDNLASWSNFGSWVDVAAPGVNIYSTYYNHSYQTMSGTSMATPFVAGEAALIWSSGLCSTNTCVRSQIEQTADHIAGTGTKFTSGRINAFNAVAALANTVTPTPTATPTPAPTATPTPTSTPVPTATPTPLPTSTPTPTPTPALTMTVKDIVMSYTNISSTTRRISSQITVINEATGKGLSGATVTFTLQSPNGTLYTFTGNTNLNGRITFNQRTTEKGTFIGTVTNVVRSSYTYQPTLTTKTLQVQ